MGSVSRGTILLFSRFHVGRIFAYIYIQMKTKISAYTTFFLLFTFFAPQQVNATPISGTLLLASGAPSASLELGLILADVARAGTVVSTVEAGAAALTLPASAAAAITLAGLVGIQMAYLKLSDGATPNTPLVIRPGATSPVPGPTVETSTPPTQGYLVNNVPYGDIKTACEAAAGYKAEVNFGAGAYFAKRELVSGVHGYGTCMLIDASGHTYSSNEGSWSYGSAVTCAPGTTYSSTVNTCLLPANAYPDLNAGIPVIQPDINGTGFVLSPGSNVNAPSVTSAPASIHSAGTGSDGNPYSVDVSPNAEGGVDITQQTQTNKPTGPGGANQPSLTTTNITTNTTGIVSSVSTSTVNNKTITTTTTNNNTTTQPIDWGSFSSSAPGNGLADGKAIIATNLSSLCGGLDCTSTFSCASGLCSVSERVTTLKSTYAVAPTASGACPAFVVDLSGINFFGHSLGSHSTVEHCYLLDSSVDTIHIIMTIIIAISGVIILMSA